MENRILSNRYTLESEIGRGGMGVVYKATDTQVIRTAAGQERLANALADGVADAVSGR